MERPDWFVEPTFGQRVLARLLDGLVLLVPATLLVVLPGTATLVVGFVLHAVYETMLVARNGQTLGKAALGLRVVDADEGTTPSVAQAITRWALLLGIPTLLTLGPRPAGLAYDVVLFALVLRPPLHRGPHDYAAGTIVTVTASGR
jgi:uncharacterized RDD family membrane protein YckC